MAMISLLVRIALVESLMLRRSLPAISGAAAIAHRLKWLWYSTSVTGPAPLSLLPTSSMSGSFQWLGPPYAASGMLVFTLVMIDPVSVEFGSGVQRFLMSVVVRCSCPRRLAHS